MKFTLTRNLSLDNVYYDRVITLPPKQRAYTSNKTELTLTPKEGAFTSTKT